LNPTTLPPKPPATFASSSSSLEESYRYPPLPFEDKLARHALQLCQLSFDPRRQQLHPIDSKILRELVPKVMHNVHEISEKADGAMDYGQLKDQKGTSFHYYINLIIFDIL